MESPLSFTTKACPYYNEETYITSFLKHKIKKNTDKKKKKIICVMVAFIMIVYVITEFLKGATVQLYDCAKISEINVLDQFVCENHLGRNFERNKQNYF